ncbi:receptor-type tyrosine-protein phosphatase H-like [Engraulis encrasicolus]|uniref:receptor-type tyrosine-protein phosphatase H-like n=1 Tax=Engraulis encrasicolus TaxID=184585 RepID=UPI002FD2A94A
MVPDDVTEVTVTNPSRTTVDLEWTEVNTAYTYILKYNGEVIPITDLPAGNSVTYTVHSLSAGTKYSFTLITVFGELESTRRLFTAVTVPDDVTKVTVTNPSRTTVDLEWTKVNNSNAYTYILKYNGEVIPITDLPAGNSVTYTVHSLSAGTKYEFTLITVFENVNSTGHEFTAVTVPDDVTEVTVTNPSRTTVDLEWTEVNTAYTYILKYNGEVIPITELPAEGNTAKYRVHSLTAGTKYEFTLITVFENVNSTGHEFTAVTVPDDVTEVTVTNPSKTTVDLEWTKVNNAYTYILKYNGEVIPITELPAEGNTVTHTVSSLTAGNKYDFTLFTVFEGVSSTGLDFSEVTVPDDVTEVTVTNPSKTTVDLEWTKVNNAYTYILKYNGEVIPITELPAEGNSVTYTVHSLTAGTKYEFTLFTVFGELESTGHEFTAVTVPDDVTEVTVTNPSKTTVDLEWTKVNNSNAYTYILKYNGEVIPITELPAEGNTAKYRVSDLSAGTNYSFTLFTVFENVNSSGFTFSAVTVPDDVTKVTVTNPSRTTVDLEWTKVNNSNAYTYILKYNGEVIPITDLPAGNSAKYRVSDLSAGTKYEFTLVTVLENVNSAGYTFTAVTVPDDVSHVNVTSRSETNLALQWMKVNNNNDYTYILRYDGEEKTITPAAGTTVTYTVSSLSAGAKYEFTLFTVFEGVNSTGYNFSEVTVPSAAEVTVTDRGETALTLEWSAANRSPGTYYILMDDSGQNETFNDESGTESTVLPQHEAEAAGLFSMATAEKGSDGDNAPGIVEGNSVSYTKLNPGDIYIPAMVTNFISIHGDFSVTMKWDKPVGVWTKIEVNGSGNIDDKDSGSTLVVSGLQPAKSYSFSVTSLSEEMRSSPQWISCQTQSTVIWLPILVIMLLAVMALMGVFILRRKPQLLSKVHMQMYERNTEMDPSPNMFKPIPMKKFPDHFHQMSCDDNREFSEEYMQFNTVGTEQTQREALLPENKSKNRFTDILPYDSSRVKLSTQGPASDYINANFIPGYGGKNKDYIAAQGPLPSTVADFWRMIWEQGSTRIVMVTNCVENGRTKCEKYWPEDRSPCRHGDLVINMTLEHKDTNWTVREFTVKNERTSEQRVLKHFHFTAWPDHGVPDGTSTLIEFRSLIRQHIDTCTSPDGPTVVHCSAGVGRTGTLIALDVLLQQLEKEDAVNIGSFVHRMRRQRPRMVQTESQYVFLHKCINDTLTQPAEEPLYMNQGINGGGAIYENIGAM